LFKKNTKNYKKQNEKKQALNMNTMQNHATQGTTKDVSIVGDKTQA
jgi:hypothetical protein